MADTVTGPDLCTADLERFWARVVRQDGCWAWTGQKLPHGYGVVRVRSADRPVGAHRISFFIANGFWPPMAMHTCDNRSCVNPAHLQAGTAADNSADMVQKGRSNIGERNPRAKLNRDDVARIRSLHSAGMAQARLAEAYGMSRAGIHRIVKHKTWKATA